MSPELAGKGNLEEAQCDQLLDYLADLLNAAGKAFFEQDPAKKVCLTLSDLNVCKISDKGDFLNKFK